MYYFPLAEEQSGKCFLTHCLGKVCQAPALNEAKVYQKWPNDNNFSKIPKKAKWTSYRLGGLLPSPSQG